MTAQLSRLLPGPPGPVEVDQAYALPGPAPHLRVNFVTSLDGAAALYGRSEGLSSPSDHRVFSALRGLCDVILVGAGTLRIEGYGPARPGPVRRAWRQERGLAAVPPVAVVTASLELDLDRPFFTEAEARPLVLTCESAPARRRAAVEAVAEVVVAGEERVEMAPAVEALADRGLAHVLCEGGPALTGQLAGAGLVDELCLSLAPLLVGPTTVRLLREPPPAGSWPITMELAHVLTDGAALFLRYAREPSNSSAGTGRSAR